MPSIVAVHATFTIYRDKPCVSQRSIKTRKASSASAKHRVIHVATATDKENIDPRTGLPPNMLAKISKKRKGDVLATKILSPRDAPSSQKKRRLASYSSTTVKAAGLKRQIQLPGDTSHSRQPSQLPSVKEECIEEREKTAVVPEPEDALLRLPPELVDARCYELTVLPLADLSEAFNCASPDESGSAASSRVQSTTTTPAPSPPHSPRRKRTSTAPVFGTEDFALHTPERKRIYSAFTFSSPSAVAKQRAASHASSKHPFSEMLFDPIARHFAQDT